MPQDAFAQWRAERRKTGKPAPAPTPLDDLTEFARARGATVTSTNRGRHNPGSAHYDNRAIDVRTRDRSPAEVEALMNDAESSGYAVRDERQRPSGQQVWGGPHLHLEAQEPPDDFAQWRAERQRPQPRNEPQIGPRVAQPATATDPFERQQPVSIGGRPLVTPTQPVKLPAVNLREARRQARDFTVPPELQSPTPEQFQNELQATRIQREQARQAYVAQQQAKVAGQGRLAEAGTRFARSAAKSTVAPLEMIAASQPTEIGEEAVRRASGLPQLDTALDEYLPVDPSKRMTANPLDPDFYSVTIPEVAGNVVPMIATGKVLPGGLASRLGATATGMMQAGGQGYREARESGATREQAQRHAGAEGVIATTEMLGGQAALGSAVRPVAREVAKDIAKDVGQEAYQQWLSNLNAADYSKIDPQRGEFEDVPVSAVGGALVSGGMNAAHAGAQRFAGNRAQARDTATVQQEPLAPPQMQRTGQLRPTQVVPRAQLEMAARQGTAPQAAPQAAPGAEENPLEAFLRERTGKLAEVAPAAEVEKPLSAIARRKLAQEQTLRERQTQAQQSNMDAADQRAEMLRRGDLAGAADLLAGELEVIGTQLKDARKLGDVEMQRRLVVSRQAAERQYDELQAQIKQQQRAVRPVAPPKAARPPRVPPSAENEPPQVQQRANAPTAEAPQQSGKLLRSVVNPEGGVPVVQRATPSFENLAEREGRREFNSEELEGNRNLWQFVKKQGGVQRSVANRGELSYLVGREGGAPGVVSDAGLPVDEMRRYANEAGFGPYETEDDFLQALRRGRNEFSNARRVSRSLADEEEAYYRQKGSAAMEAPESPSPLSQWEVRRQAAEDKAVDLRQRMMDVNDQLTQVAVGRARLSDSEQERLQHDHIYLKQQYAEAQQRLRDLEQAEPGEHSPHMQQEAESLAGVVFTPSKPAEQMTRAEWEAQPADWKRKNDHELAIIKALKHGQSVPGEVLAGYPRLKARYAALLQPAEVKPPTAPLDSAYRKLGTEDAQSISDLYARADDVHRRSSTPEERARAQQARELVGSLTEAERRAVAEVLPERRFSPVKEADQPNYGRAVQDIALDEANPQELANFESVANFFDEMAKGSAALTQDEHAAARQQLERAAELHAETITPEQRRIATGLNVLLTSTKGDAVRFRQLYDKLHEGELTRNEAYTLKDIGKQYGLAAVYLDHIIAEGGRRRADTAAASSRAERPVELRREATTGQPVERPANASAQPASGERGRNTIARQGAANAPEVVGETSTTEANPASQPLPQEQRTVVHDNPTIHGKPIVAETADGRVIVPNEANKSGVSVVKDQSGNLPEQGAAFGVRQSGFPDGSWYVTDQHGEIVRFGVPMGELPRRFKTSEAAFKAGEKWVKQQDKIRAGQKEGPASHPDAAFIESVIREQGGEMPRANLIRESGLVRSRANPALAALKAEGRVVEENGKLRLVKTQDIIPSARQPGAEGQSGQPVLNKRNPEAGAVRLGGPPRIPPNFDLTKHATDIAARMKRERRSKAEMAQAVQLLRHLEAAQKANDAAAFQAAHSQLRTHVEGGPVKRAVATGGEVLNFARSLMLTGDLPHMRQGLFLTVPPRYWKQATTDTVEALHNVRDATFKAFRKMLENAPAAKLGTKYDLYLASNGMAEENFASKWAHKFFLTRKVEQVYASYLDLRRIDAFERAARRILRNTKLGAEEKETALRDAARAINILSGRGQVGETVESAIPLLNKILLAPRYTISRLQIPTLLQPQKPGYRDAVRDLAETSAVLLSLGGLAVAAGVASTSLDYDDPDFLKLRVGNKVYDLSAGLAPVAKIAAQVSEWAWSQRPSETRRERKRVSEETVSDLARFSRGKLSPAASLMADALSDWTNMAGEKVTPTKAVLDRVIPLILRDTANAWQAEGPVGAAEIFLPAELGVGTAVYPQSPLRQSALAGDLRRFDLPRGNLYQKAGEPKETFKERQQAYGEMSREFARKLADAPTYKAAPDEEKKAMLGLLGERLKDASNEVEPDRAKLEPDRIQSDAEAAEARRRKKAASERGRLRYQPER